jgi:alpha,alpha-trehalase
MEPLPHALHDQQRFEAALDRRELHVFLDYDGTLTPIVPRPEQAVLDPRMRLAVQRLARRYPLAIISGRELADVKARVGLPQLFYAGNHGFEIAGPKESGLGWQIGQEYTDMLDALHHTLRQRLPPRDGLIIEHKRYSLSIHYRLLADNTIPGLEQILVGILAAYPQLRLRYGKKVFEIRPDLDWHKGKAMLRLAEAFSGQPHGKAMLLFIGDDLTDEDAFEELRGNGVGILVGDGRRQTSAHFRLDDSAQVRQLLEYLTSRP